MKVEAGKYYRTRDGRKVGPMTVYADILFSGRDEEFGAVRIFHADGQHFVGYEEYDLIAEWTDTPTGPVITETVKRIVPGVYGKVEICEDDSYGGGIGVYVNSMFNRDDLTAAIETLTAIRDAL